MPPKPRWLLAIPDAISQLEKLDRTLLTRRDIERLFGVSTARAATLMQTFGAEMTGCQRTLPRTKLLRQLRKHRARAAFRGEEERRERLLTGLRKARLTGIRVTLPAETLDAKLASLPEGVSVSRDRIEVRFNGAKEAVERLYALAYQRVVKPSVAPRAARTPAGCRGARGQRTPLPAGKERPCLTRREEGAYWAILQPRTASSPSEQRSQAGCIAARMQRGLSPRAAMRS